MNKHMTIGLDLAKNVFHLICLDLHGKVAWKKKLRRAQLRSFLANLPPWRIGMEACGSAHFWGRELTALGHEVKLIPAQHVKPYVRGNKNDYNDALAIAEALDRPGLHFVGIKSPAQQDIQALHRLRERCVHERTAVSNQLRGLLAEYGLILPKGMHQVRRHLPALLEDAENSLSELLRRLLGEAYRQLQELDAHVDSYTQELRAYAQQHEACQRLMTIPGFGAIVASVFYSVVGHGEAYRRGRDVSASLGLVPRQHSSGDKPVLLGISKRGDRYLRSLLVHGARSVVMRAAGKDDRLSRWISRICEKRGFNKAVVALANKMARIGWVVLARQEVYRTA